MKKKIILLAFALMLFAGIVSASSINGDYKGNPIVKITSGDRVLETDEVPGFIYEGHTVVPISTLRQLGASVTWDVYGYSVDVRLPQGPSNIPSPSNVTVSGDSVALKQLAKLADMYKITQDLSDRISRYSDFLTLYFQGRSNNYRNQHTDADVNERLQQLIDHYNSISDKFNLIKTEFTVADMNALIIPLQLNFQALETYKSAAANILDWNYYKNDSRRSQASFDEYLKNSDKGFKLSNQAWTSSKDGYDANILKIINN